MNKVITGMLATCVLLAAPAAVESAYAQDSHHEAPRYEAPGTANDSWESGAAGARVRTQPDDAIEDGRVVGEDPDPNIRSQLQREYRDGGDGD